MSKMQLMYLIEEEYANQLVQLAPLKLLEAIWKIFALISSEYLCFV